MCIGPPQYMILMQWQIFEFLKIGDEWSLRLMVS